MSSVDEATRAKTLLRERLGRPHWLRGVGVSSAEDEDYYVQVNVDALTSEVRRSVPKKVNGVRVCVEPVGRIRFLHEP